LDQGKFSVAIEEFKKLTQLQPNSAPDYVNLGDAYFKNGNYELAIAALEQGLRLNPKLTGAEQTLGVSLLLLGNAAAAIPHLEKAPTPELLGLAYLETGKFMEAIGAWQKVLSDHPNDQNALYYLSRSTALASKQASDRLISLDRGSARAHEVMADRDTDMGRFADAVREYTESLRLKSDVPGVHMALGRAMAATGNLAGAVAEFQAEAKLQPANADNYYYLGIALLTHGLSKEAVEALGRADELAPDVPGTLLALGKAQQLTGDVSQAEKSLTKVLALVKDGDMAAQAHSELGGIYQKSGRQADADREMAAYSKLMSGGR
jgi:tetratricopeptide (TPR) repeat protein